MVKHKKVKWKADAVREVNLVPPMRKNVSDLSTNKEIVESLRVGSMWIAKKNLEPIYSNSSLKYLGSASRATGANCSVPKGTIAIFLGTERFDEMKRSGSTCRVLRQIFLINGLKYMVESLDKLFAPVRTI